jgi:hypothetical protein
VAEQGELPAIQRASLHLYQLYDDGFAIDLERARGLVSAPSARVPPVVTRGGSIDIPQLPLEISVGGMPLTLASMQLQAEMQARIYDLGIIALRLVVRLPEGLTWDQANALMAHVQRYPASITEAFARQHEVLRKLLLPAMERPNETVRAEDYTILLIEGLGPGAPASEIARHPTLLRTALGEDKPLSAAAATLATPLSYYQDDLILLTWAAAIVIEPDPAAREDATLLLEFANAQLLSFRSYDAEVERGLARITPRIARTRRLRWRLLWPAERFEREIYRLIADITDTSQRVENALKVTEDVYWNRVYVAALAVLRVEVWRAGISEALDVLRQTASLVHNEAQEAWTTFLEVVVIVLIAVELVVALLGLH